MEVEPISSQQGINHWIPFTREQVGCKKTFKSTFMADYLNGKIKPAEGQELFGTEVQSIAFPLQTMSPEAQAVYDAGLALLLRAASACSCCSSCCPCTSFCTLSTVCCCLLGAGIVR